MLVVGGMGGGGARGGGGTYLFLILSLCYKSHLDTSTCLQKSLMLSNLCGGGGGGARRFSHCVISLVALASIHLHVSRKALG